MELTIVVLKNNIFKFDEKSFTQIRGRGTEYILHPYMLICLQLA